MVVAVTNRPPDGVGSRNFLVTPRSSSSPPGSPSHQGNLRFIFVVVLFSPLSKHFTESTSVTPGEIKTLDRTGIKMPCCANSHSRRGY